MIEFKNVSLSFGDKVILHNFNRVFEDNKVYCLVGPSGCGKTTMLRMACGLQRPNSGTILHDGKPVHKEIQDIFMMHQHHVNFPWKNVLDNILLPLKYNDGKITSDEVDRAKEMLSLVGLGGSENLYPHELSGGMNQRVALARVLVARPKVLLMDEPMSALDPSLRVQMQDLILKFHRDAESPISLIILVTHDMAEANRLADEMIEFTKVKEGGC